MQFEMAMSNKTDLKEKTTTEIKQSFPPKIVRQLDSSTDIHKYLVTNDNAVLGLFCQEGCRYCQIAKERMILLGRILQSDSVDIVIVNIKHPAVPPYLSIPWTPYLRFKSQGSSTKWKDAPQDQKYDITSIFNFLHTSVVKARYVRDSLDITPDIRHNGDKTGYISSDGSQRQDTNSTYSKLRVKRGVQQTFMRKHVWEYAQIDSIRFQDAEFQFNMVKADHKLIPDNKVGNRRHHSFIVTANLQRTQTELDSISTGMYMALPNDENKEKLGNKLLPNPIDIQSFNTSISLVQLTLRPSRTREDLIVIECIFALQGSFQVGGSVRKNGFNLAHFDKILLDNNVKRPCFDDTTEPDGTCNVDT